MLDFRLVAFAEFQLRMGNLFDSFGYRRTTNLDQPKDISSL